MSHLIMKFGKLSTDSFETIITRKSGAFGVLKIGLNLYLFQAVFIHFDSFRVLCLSRKIGFIDFC